jgi:predicted DNA-binding antitoxin AbrB/MazE fold protein
VDGYQTGAKMSIHTTAIYENGVLKLDAPLALAERSRVSIEIVVGGDFDPSHCEASQETDDPLDGVIGIGSGPVDSAENHDHYLYGMRKQ